MTDRQHDEIERLTNLCYEYLGELTALRAAKQTQDMMWDALTIGSAWVRDGKRLEPTNVYTTPPAAQRTWVGLTDAELVDMHATLMVKLRGCYETKDLYRAIEQRLKEKNT